MYQHINIYISTHGPLAEWFLAVNQFIHKYRNKFNFESVLMLRIFNFNLDNDHLAGDKQLQKSYCVFLKFGHLFLSFLTTVTAKRIQ